MGNNGSTPSSNGATPERKVPLASPQLLESELREAMDAYRSGWLCMGPRTAELEASMCAYTGARNAIAVSSCSAAMHIACLATELGPGDEVIVPSLAFAATVNAIASTGATPRFAEIAGPSRPWLSAAAAEAAIGPRTRAIMTMSYGGHPGEIAELAALAERRGLTLLEDAAHAAGSWHRDRHMGTFGTAGALSFSASKNLGIGEGGMLLTDDDEVARRARSLRWHGISASTWERRRGAAAEYTVNEVGLNYRIDDPRAALVNARLRRLDDDNRKRAAVDAAYRAAFSTTEEVLTLAEHPGGEPASNCVFAIVLGEGIDRMHFRERLSRRGVETSIHFPPLHATPAYGAEASHMPLTEAFASRTVSLPIFPDMEEWQQDIVIEATLEATTAHDEATGGEPRSHGAVVG